MISAAVDEPNALTVGPKAGALGTAPIMISVERLEKSFPVSYTLGAWIKHRGAPPRRTVLSDISLAVRRGELFGLLGPNGAGKTTLLKVLATLAIPDRGTIIVNGLDAARDAMAVKQQIGLCTSEERSFYFRLTARQNLAFFGAMVGLHGKPLERRIKEVVEIVDLDADLDRRFDGYSSGMRQRLTLARALLSDPEILFLDEPTRAVDPMHADSIRTLIREELVDRRGKTVILATNLLEEAWSLCDTIAILRRGEIAALGPPKVLGAQFVSVRLLRYEITVDRADDEMLARTRAIPGVVRFDVTPSADGVVLGVEVQPTGTALTQLLRAVSSNGVLVRNLKSQEARPLEVFADLTKEKTE
ncbi:MAG: ABC transporter ATP-binding protein [Candidatus Eremiobacteraeota bacterium]|nr:ABC transporter ATP-binding protein [Candidatus Eremiobacteraeota bacterium]